LHNLNSSTPQSNTIQVAQNWNIYREQRASEAFMNNHYAYSSTRTKATLPPLGNNGLGALMALLDGPVTTKEAAEDIGYSYDAMARSLRRTVVCGLVHVDIGERGLKTYTLKEEWREILKANIPLMPTYAVQLVRQVDALKSRESILLFNGEDEKADKVGKEYLRMAALLAKVKAAAGIVPFGHVDKSIVEGDLSNLEDAELVAVAKAGRRKPKADTTPTVNKHEERRRRLTHAIVIGERAEHRLPVAMTKPTDANKWRRKEYARTQPKAESRWEEFHAWAVVEYGAGWWAKLDETDILGRYKIFEYACERVPTIKWAGQQPDYHQLRVIRSLA
jgi:DNA-binding transcriptional ArsR family regulator